VVRGAGEVAPRAEGRRAREVRVAAAPPLRRSGVHLERRPHPRDQREPRVRRGVPGVPRGRLGGEPRDPLVRACRCRETTRMTTAATTGTPPPEHEGTHHKLMRMAAWVVAVVVTLAFLRVAGVDVWGWLDQLWDQVKKISAGYIVLGCFFQGCQTVFTALGWYGILSYAYRGQVPFRLVLASYAAGVALNNFLPANIGTLVTLLMYVAIIETCTFPGVLAGYVVQKIFYFIIGTFIYIYLFASLAGSFSFQFGGLRD